MATTREDIGAEVDRRVKTYRLGHPGTSYREALKAVLDADRALKLAYAGA